MDSEGYHIKCNEEFIETERGVKLFTCRWIPTNNEPKALICLCHGYGVECSVFMKDTSIRLAQAGYAVFGIDSEGHGKSEGLRGYIKSFETLVDDSASFFTKKLNEYSNKCRFLFGESMGGAVALSIHRKQPDVWNGAVLIAPMCKISKEIKPSPLVSSFLKRLTNIIPTWKTVPTKFILDRGFQCPENREKVFKNPYLYKGRIRLRTAHELLIASLEIENNLHQVNLPFLVGHGEDDKVTNPDASKMLYESATSIDKTLKMYPRMWHGLLCGESEENTKLVFNNILSWLEERTIVKSDITKDMD